VKKREFAKKCGVARKRAWAIPKKHASVFLQFTRKCGKSSTYFFFQNFVRAFGIGLFAFLIVNLRKYWQRKES
jgi:hypothetical protein